MKLKSRLNYRGNDTPRISRYMYSDIFDRTTISAIEILTSCPIDATYIYTHINLQQYKRCTGYRIISCFTCETRLPISYQPETIYHNLQRSNFMVRLRGNSLTERGHGSRHTRSTHLASVRVPSFSQISIEEIIISGMPTILYTWRRVGAKIITVLKSYTYGD